MDDVKKNSANTENPKGSNHLKKLLVNNIFASD